MFCTSCGAEIPPNAAFCSRCGVAVAPTVTDVGANGALSTPRTFKQNAQEQSARNVPRGAATLVAAAVVVGLLVSLWWLGAFGPPSPKYPEAYGLYVWNAGQWTELGPVKTTITLEFPGDIKFLIHDKAIDRVARSFQLTRKVFVRNVITQNPDGTGKKIERYRKWDVKGEDFVEGRFSAVKKEPEMVTWAPVAPLGAGIYEPQLGADSREAFTVSKQAVFANLDFSELCYDRVRTMAFGIPMGAPDQYISCKSSPAAAAAPKSNVSDSKSLDKELITAVIGDRVDLSKIEQLIANGARATANDDYNAISVLGYAINRDRVEIADLLIRRGANVNGLSTGDPKRPEWFNALSTRMFDLLLLKGADIKARGSDGRTVLHVVEEPSLVDFLLNKGAEVNARDNWGRTPLAQAKERQQFLSDTKTKGITVHQREQTTKKNSDLIDVLVRHGGQI